MKVSGHKTESIYTRYAIVDPEMMDDATRRIERRAEQTALAQRQSDSLRANNGQTSTKHMDGYDSN
jgi:hypothetical protein